MGRTDLEFVDLTNVEELTDALSNIIPDDRIGQAAEIIARKVTIMRAAWEEKVVKELGYQQKFRASLAVQLLSGNDSRYDGDVDAALKVVDQVLEKTKEEVSK